LMDGKKAIGVRTIGGKEYFANRDVLLSAGVRFPVCPHLSYVGR